MLRGAEDEDDGESFVLSTVPVAEPPPGPSVVGLFLGDRAPEVEFAGEPASAVRGETVEMVLENADDVTIVASESGLVPLYRWEEQRWLPVGEQPFYKGHPAVEAERAEVHGGERRSIATVVTGALDPGWYSVYVGLSTADEDDLFFGVQGSFRVTPVAEPTEPPVQLDPLPQPLSGGEG